MASSGVSNYSVTELEVVKAILSKIGVLQNSQSPKPADIEIVRRNLNMIYKQWVAQADFAPGLKMWTRKRAYLFLDNKAQYDIGPSGDECAAEEYVSMTLADSATAAAVTLTVDDGSDAALAMRIGVLTTDGFHWTTISGVSGTTITLTAPLSASADAGSEVFAYVSKPVKPFEIMSASLRDTEVQDSPMDPNLSLLEYEMLPSKQNTGTPFSFYQEAKKDGMRIYLDCVPNDFAKVMRLVYYSYIEDTSAQTQDVDFPGEWFRALVGQGALDCAMDFARPVTPELKAFRDEGLRMAQNAHPAKSTAYYASEPDEY
jgi:hypothetical protein